MKFSIFEYIDKTDTNMTVFCKNEILQLLILCLLCSYIKHPLLKLTIRVQFWFHFVTLILSLCTNKLTVLFPGGIFDVVALMFGLVYISVGYSYGPLWLCYIGIFILFSHINSLIMKKHPITIFGSIYE